MCGCNTHIHAQTSTEAAVPAGLVAFSVPDMTCNHCAGTLTAAFAETLPGAAIEIDLPAKQLRVAAPADVATAIIIEAGYTPSLL